MCGLWCWNLSWSKQLGPLEGSWLGVPVDQSVGRSVGWLVGWLIGWLAVQIPVPTLINAPLPASLLSDGGVNRVKWLDAVQVVTGMSATFKYNRRPGSGSGSDSGSGSILAQRERNGCRWKFLCKFLSQHPNCSISVCSDSNDVPL